jgi:CubicO group peptidase (beta-lactamase class C family)
MNRYVLVVFFCLLAFGAYAQKPLNTAELDAYINKGMADFDIPGLAIGIVKDGKTVYLKGFGTRVYGKAEPVDTNTLFMIASNSKLFTGTIISHLVSKKQLTLDDKVTKFYPDFRLYDTLSTLQVTVRDMLTHRIGTKTFQGDFTFLDGNLSRLEIMRRMRYLKPSAVFRQDYGYCNSCYLTAGMVAEKVTGRPWEALVTDSILKPLGMTRTSALSNHMASLSNVSYPFTTSYTGKVMQQPFDVWDNLGPAASIISSVSDMTHWLQFQLDSGRYQGKRVMAWPTRQPQEQPHPYPFQGLWPGLKYE